MTTAGKPGHSSAAVAATGPGALARRETAPARWETVVADVGRPHAAGALGNGFLRGIPRGLLIALLGAWDPPPGTTVLLIGDGTPAGHLAAGALCAVLGARAVTLLEGHTGAVSPARAALSHAGHQPTVAAGHGLHGWPDTAPHDGILSLRAPWRLPAAWITQTRPGGRILTPLGGLDPTLLAFGVADDLGEATGSAVPVTAPPGVFGPLAPAETLGRLAAAGPRLPTSTDTPALTATALTTALGEPGFRRLLDLAFPDVDHYSQKPGAHLFVDRAPTPSWALLTHPGTLTGTGPRPLPRELMKLAAWWTSAGTPLPGTWTLTVDTDGRHLLNIAQPLRGAVLRLPDLPGL